MAKSRNSLLGVGGQRKKLSRADQQGMDPARQADRKAADDQKQELLRRMRERTQSAPDLAREESSDGSSQPDMTEQDGPAQS
ncbi:MULTISPECIES: DUF6243 family protein [unclassified Streptomyces]|uniref:DUF6243 family protein n=1 Tax=unclassified Streptomyces TaxID=2593676 RepID=UPI00093C4125|nr:DUF6243 family protein [Streptomyces sp. CB01580]OKJ33283.1 hypothetical protein AMK22_21130 [Streptomyces sp. CB01580]